MVDCMIMAPQLRVRNPDAESLRSEHYLYTSFPSQADLERVILHPVAAGGVPLLGDVCLYRGNPFEEGQPLMMVYSGIPEKSMVVLHRGNGDVVVKTCEDRMDVFVLCPDHTPDVYHRVPYAAFIPRFHAVQIASDFVATGKVEVDESWIDFEPFYWDLLENPVS